MATIERGGIKHAAQAENSAPITVYRTNPYHPNRFRDYLAARARVANMPDRATEAEHEAAANEATEILDGILSGGVSCARDVMLKARAAAFMAIDSAQGSVMDPRVFHDILSIIAGDLETLIAADALKGRAETWRTIGEPVTWTAPRPADKGHAKHPRKPTGRGGKAVRS
jgi:hypothetical protein